MRRGFRPARRRAYSLIEMMLVLGALVLVLSLCGGLMHTLLRLDRAGRAGVADAAGLGRLARQFRRDVRGALVATPTAPGVTPGLGLVRPSGPAIFYYSLDAGRLVREETYQGEPKARAREEYAVGRLGPVGFEVDGRWVRLTLGRRGTPTTGPQPGPGFDRPPLRLEARLDKDRDPADPAPEAHRP